MLISYVTLILWSLSFSHCLSSDSNDPLKVHVLLHSHMDAGWIYTFEEYYRGTNTDYGGCVSCILNNVYGSLQKNTDRKYQIAEVSFFNRWWSEQTDDVKAGIRTLIQQGQIEFVNGGWVTNDEACAYYEDIVDQFITGHRWLMNTLNVYPNVGWQIDSFGHSATHAALMAQAGYDGLFFGRIDFQDWQKRREEQALEVNWEAASPRNESIFSHILYAMYSDTKYFIDDNFYCRSIFCDGNLSSSGYQKVENWIKLRSFSYKTKNIALLVGDDFHLWRESEKDFLGIDAMIDYYNNQNPDKGLKVKYSTLSEYVEEFTKDVEASKVQLPEKHGDFFPYIENQYTSWVGYFTSKSLFKQKVRELSQYYNAAKLLFAKFMLENNEEVLKLDEGVHAKINAALSSLEDPLSIVQHHDAVSGTMKEYVKSDYERMMKDGKNNVDKVSLT